MKDNTVNQDHPDNDKDLDEILNTLVSLIASNQVDFSENTVSFEEAQRIGTKYTDKAKKAIQKYAQSKLKAFAGEVNTSLPTKKKGHAECLNPNCGKIMSVAEVEDRNFNTGQCTCGWKVKFVMPLIDEGYNRALTEVAKALKAIKEKAGIE